MVRGTSPPFLPLRALPCLTRHPPRSLSPHRARAPPPENQPPELDAAVTVHSAEAHNCVVPLRVTSRSEFRRQSRLTICRPSTGIDLRQAKLPPRR
jgi:hypothetical protein